jgi:hypothetical protein
VADGWCWFVLREKYCWLVAGGWFVVREKYCWLVADKPSEQAASWQLEQVTVRINFHVHAKRKRNQRNCKLHNEYFIAPRMELKSKSYC